jgi:hypothetical protein
MASNSHASRTRLLRDLPTCTLNRSAGFGLDDIGMYVLLTLICLVPFHQLVSAYFLYYKEAFAALFVALLCFRLTRGIRCLHRKIELTFLFLFPCLLLALAVVDDGKLLYDDSAIEYSANITGIPPALVILRNATLYLPMVTYLTVRGISKNEVRKVAYCCAFVAPLSISLYIYSSPSLSVRNIGASGGDGTAYLNYVPYLTYASLCGCYLLFITVTPFVRIAVSTVVLVIVYFAVLSTGRQNILFIAGTVALFMVFAANLSYSRAVAVVSLMAILTLGVGYIYLQNFEVSQKLVARFSSMEGFFDLGDSVAEAPEVTRYQIMLNGLAVLTPQEYLWGAGLGSSNGPGPHNDYIRWIQRVGLIVATVGYLPFFISIKRLVPQFKFRNTDPIQVFILLGLIFTMFYSVFGFPREDPYESPFVFLGLAISLGYRCSPSRKQAGAKVAY